MSSHQVHKSTSYAHARTLNIAIATYIPKHAMVIVQLSVSPIHSLVTVLLVIVTLQYKLLKPLPGFKLLFSVS